jgi:dTDP-glucose pyrophosphorylase
MIDRVLESYPIPCKDTKHIFITNSKLAYGFDYGVYVLTKETLGPLDTVFKPTEVVKTLSQSDDELLICDCDSVIDREELLHLIAKFKTSGARGGVTVRRGDNPAWSYAVLDSDGFVLETAEKKVISEWSSTGPYWFASAKEFVRYGAFCLLDNRYSVSEVYNYFIKDGHRVKAEETKTFEHLGTPEELLAYERAHNINSSLRKRPADQRVP